jgi:hypothetical protein
MGFGCRPIARGRQSHLDGLVPGERGFVERSWEGYNEGMALNLLALGSRSHPAKGGAFDAWTAPFPKYWCGEGAKPLPFLYAAFRASICGRVGCYCGIYDATTRGRVSGFKLTFPSYCLNKECYRMLLSSPPDCLLIVNRRFGRFTNAQFVGSSLRMVQSI